MPRNLLFIVLDQFRADLLTGPLGDSVPLRNLRRLAQQSLNFTNHHTVMVPCGPSRASLLTGQYAMTHRSVHNGTPLHDHIPNLATCLRSVGRELLLFGYTDTQPDPTHLHPNDPARRSYTGPIKGITEVIEMREESWAWLAHLRGQGYDVPDADAPDFHRLYRPKGGALGGPALYDARDSDTAYLTDQTIRQLDVRKARPWSAMVTYIRPHPPFVAPDPWHSLVDPNAVPDPAQGCAAHPFFVAYHAAPSSSGMFWGFDGDHAALTPAQIAIIRATYLGLAAEVDHHIGRLLDWLEATGQADDTMVVLTADHGEMLGDLGLWGKRTPFRAASHVPLMIRAPGMPVGAVDAPTRSIDLAPTLLGAFGAQVPPQMQGHTLTREGLPDDTPVMVEMELGEMSGGGRFERAWGAASSACRAVAFETGSKRLVHFAGNVPSMLFDVAADPDCARDLAPNDPDSVAQLTAALLSFRMQSAAPYF